MQCSALWKLQVAGPRLFFEGTHPIPASLKEVMLYLFLQDGLGKGSLECGTSVVLEVLPQIHLTPATEEAGTCPLNVERCS